MATVLFVDDQIRSFRSLLNVVKQFLSDLDIVISDNGREGLELAMALQPDLIFLDISMPEMDGYEVCRELKKHQETATIPVLFLTSLDADLQSQLDALDLGAVDFLRKPISSVELALRIRVMLRLNDYTHRLEELVAQQTKKIEKQRAMAARTERLAAMGTLAAGIAHEVNQPLNALKVTADGLLYWKERDEEISEAEVFEGLRFISDQANRIDYIVRHMHELVHQGRASDIQAADVREVVGRALSLIGQQLSRHDIEVTYQYEEKPVPAYLLPSQLEQAVINLLTNAMHALDKMEQGEKWVRIETEIKEKVCTLTITDSGSGIPEEHLEHIFDPFFTLDDSGKGMGLGLSITQNLVSSMGGSLTVNNAEDAGACFQITLKRADQKEIEAS